MREGSQKRALYQLMEGTATVECKVNGRPHAVVVARKESGDLFGEREEILLLLWCRCRCLCVGVHLGLV